MCRLFVVTISLLLLASCANPVPSERNRYVGNWQSHEMTLLIMPDGTVAYERHIEGKTRSLTGPIKEFKGNDIVVGVAFLTKRLSVTEPPVRINGQWQMIVDGVKLTKVEG